MTALIDFLLARVAEDEAAAEHGLGCDDAHPMYPISHYENHPDPRAIAEARVKREIVDLHRGSYRDLCGAVDWRGDRVDDVDSCDILRALAAVYADHPEYQQEWA